MSQFKSEFFNLMVERGFYNQCTNETGFDTYLYECEKSGKPAVGYLGSDPTGDSLHVGHIVPLMMMRWFQKCGHKPLTLVGGATARIGDPSGKDKLRPFLDEATLQHNIEGLKKSFGKFLKFGDGANDAVMVDNWDWFKNVNYLEFLRDIGTCYSVNRMLTMESVKSRLDREQPMSFLEFNYMLLQDMTLRCFTTNTAAGHRLPVPTNGATLPRAQNWGAANMTLNCLASPVRLLPTQTAKRWASPKATRSGLTRRNCRAIIITNISATSAMPKSASACGFIPICRWMKFGGWKP